MHFMSARKKTNAKKPTNFFALHKRLWKWLLGIFIGIIVLALAIYVAFQVSPWPNALIIRYGFEQNNAKVNQAMQKYVPTSVTQVENQQYHQGDNDALMDVFYPNNTTTPLPTIVWVHGGAWVSGNKEDMDNYLQIFAARGFTAVSVNYSIAPEKQYPTPIVQLNEALGYVQQNAKRLNIDPSRIILAGDSAGSQIVAQMANIITSQSYANQIGIQPKLAANNLKAMLLNCGAYDLALPDYNGPFGKLLHTVLWAYSGTQNFLQDATLKTASVVNYVTPAFPPSFITAGNVDPLLGQSTEFAKKLGSLGVPTSTLFYPANHQPQLNHEYQFDLDTPDGQNALNQMVAFAKSHTK